MNHTVLTFITKVEPGRVKELAGLLDEIAGNLLGNAHLPFPALKRLHFASLFLNEDKSYGAYLIFENNFDGDLEDYLDDLYAQAAAGLHRIYSCCRDYPATSAADRPHMLAYLRRHVVRPNAYHVGNVGRSLERVRQEDALRDGLETFLDDVVKQGGASAPPATIRQKIQGFVQGIPAFAWALRSQPRQTLAEWLVPRLKLVAAALAVLLLVPVIIPISIVWLIVLRSKERSDPAQSTLGDQAHIKELVRREDRTRVVQNHMASFTQVKPGWFRQATLRVVLWMVNLIAHAVFTKGKLLGIPTIHFAHWSLIDNGRRLLFVSNFDGSWENYLDDFIDKASVGLTAIWSNTAGFPRTSFLICEGARDGARFKAYARDSQTYTNVWYSAYPHLTVEAINNNTSIREDLFTALDDAGTRSWLWRF
ncbi:MAG TPA: hypothetical protein VJ842_07200 [Pyrinomonadaceae bacterium]|nr:hypothetical protein [Pyrinomonadaceae bacterium]